MKIEFIGAAHEVTGSCHYLQTCGKNILIDCGLEQGEDVYQDQELPIEASQIDYVLLTHAHIDHTGKLPLLYANGFRGSVYTTEATVDLCKIMLKDCAHIQAFEAEWRNRKAKRAGLKEYVPLYTMEDALGVMDLFIPCSYEKKITLCEGISVRFSDVGHLLGSASIEIWMKEEDQEEKIVFSGDIGNINQPIIKDPSFVKHADYVVMESTYGDRFHKESPDYVSSLAKIIEETFQRGGNVVIPSFAVGRTQELLYFIRKIKNDKLIKSHPEFEVYVDSPLAIEATNIFNKNVKNCFDEEALELVNQGINPISFDGLKLSITSDDSKAINFDQKPKVILSASGMCEAGRIRHHLKHNLWRPECTVLFVGYQAHGTLGRILLEGAQTVTLFGEKIEVHAKIEKLDGISGHADKNGLIKWVTSFEKPPKKVFVVHGEDVVSVSFADYLQKEYGLSAEAPFSGSIYDMTDNDWEYVAAPIAVMKKDHETKRSKEVFERLLHAGQKLLGIIRRSEGRSNKDLIKMTDQINALCDKWDI